MHRMIQEWMETALYPKGYKYAKRLDLSDRFRDLFMEELRPTIKQTDGEGNTFYMCSRQDIDEFYSQGLEILTALQDNAHKIFPTENIRLYGIEVLLTAPIRKGLQFTGSIDIVTHDTVEDEYVIYDLKTSRSGWSERIKNDPMKKSQILLYKKYFCDEHNISPKKVRVEYVILKRILFASPHFTVPRISKFSPSNGTPSMNKTVVEFEEFLDTCYDMEGDPIVAGVKPTPSKDNCKYCAFRTRKDDCPVGVGT